MEDTKNKKLKFFLRQNIFLLIAFLICIFLAFYNLGNIEFWGEDEGQSLLNAARIILGFQNHSLANLTSFYQNAVFSPVILIQVPFILLFGVNEFAARFASALVTVLTLFVIYKIGKLFLNNRSVNLLVILFSVSGAIGLFKTAFGVSFYIFFILLSFYNLQKFLIENDKNKNFYFSLLFLALAVIFVPDALYFIPYFFIVILANIKKITLKRFFLALIAPLAIVGTFIYFEFFLSKKLTGEIDKTYYHFLSRQEGVKLSFNIKALILDYITNYSIFLFVLFVVSLIVIFYFAVKKRLKNIKILKNLYLLFLFHFLFWMVAVKNECGHLMHSYPLLIFTIAYAYDLYNPSTYDLPEQEFIKFFKNKKLTKNSKNAKSAESFQYSKVITSLKLKTPKLCGIFITALVILIICFNFYHTFILFNNLDIEKTEFTLIFMPGKIPCGYPIGRKVGIKSAAYILRDKKESIQDMLVSDLGGAFNFIYMGGNLTGPYTAYNSIELIVSGEDVYRKHKVRFIAVLPDFPNKQYLSVVEKKNFNKYIIIYKEKPIYIIYDTAKAENKIFYIKRDEYDEFYNQKYKNVKDTIPYFLNF